LIISRGKIRRDWRTCFKEFYEISKVRWMYGRVTFSFLFFLFLFLFLFLFFFFSFLICEKKKKKNALIRHLQEQLILYMALAKGESKILTGHVSLSTETAIYLAEHLTSVLFITHSSFFHSFILFIIIIYKY